MKIRWFIESSGCQFAQCGLTKGSVIEIPDDEIPDDAKAKGDFIDEWVRDEFERQTSYYWEIESP